MEGIFKIVTNKGVVFVSYKNRKERKILMDLCCGENIISSYKPDCPVAADYTAEQFLENWKEIVYD